MNDALWDEIRCRQRGAEEKGCGSANGRVGHAAEGRGGRRSSRQGAALTSLHAYCGNLFKKQLDAASPNSHTSPLLVPNTRASRKGALRRAGEREGWERTGMPGSPGLQDHPARAPKFTCRVTFYATFLVGQRGREGGEGGGSPHPHPLSPGVVI